VVASEPMDATSLQTRAITWTCVLVLMAVAALPRAQAASPLLRAGFVAQVPAPCTSERLLAALRLRIPNAQERSDAALAPGDLEATVQGAGEQWSLVVKGSDGLPLLHRTLPEPGATCTELVETAALVVDRFLVEIRWPGLGPAAFRVEPAVPLAAPVTPGPATERPALKGHLLLGPTGGVVVATGRVSPGLHLGFGLARGSARFELKVGALLPASRAFDDSPTAPLLEVWTGHGQLTAGGLVRLGRWTLFFGGSAGVERARVEVTGEERLRAQAVSAGLPFVGPGIGVERGLVDGLGLGLSCDARVYARSVRLTLEGYEQRVEMPRLNALCSAQLTWQVF